MSDEEVRAPGTEPTGPGLARSGGRSGPAWTQTGAEPPGRRGHPARLAEAVAGFLLGLLASTLVAVAWIGVTGGDSLDLAGKAVSQLPFWAGLVGAAVWSSRKRGTGSLATDFGFRARGRDVGIGIAAGVAAHVVLLRAVALILQPLLGEPDVGGPVNDLVNEGRGAAFVGLVAFIAMGAPIVEELFFRGLLLAALRRRMGTAAAVAVSSVAFGLTHAQAGFTGKGLVLALTSLSVLGALFAVLAVRTGRLGASIVAHATFNAITLFVVVAAG